MCRSAPSQGCASAQSGQTCMSAQQVNNMHVQALSQICKDSIRVLPHQNVSDLYPLPKVPSFAQATLERSYPPCARCPNQPAPYSPARQAADWQACRADNGLESTRDGGAYMLLHASLGQVTAYICIPQSRPGCQNLKRAAYLTSSTRTPSRCNSARAVAASMPHRSATSSGRGTPARVPQSMGQDVLRLSRHLPARSEHSSPCCWAISCATEPL